MRRLQHGLAMLIAMFALAGFCTLSGCEKEESPSDVMEDAADDAGDAMEDAADKAEEMAEDAADAMDGN